MTEQTLTYRDEALNLDEAYYYALLIKVASSSFSYAITYKNKLLAYNDDCSLSELTEPLYMQDILCARYKKLIIALPSTGFTLIPKNLFSTDHLAQIGHLLDVQENEQIIAKLLDADNYIVFKLDSQFLEGLKQYGLQNVVFKPTGWIKALAQKNPENHQLFVDISHNKVDIAYFQNFRLRFYNNFDYTNADDVVYYAAMVARELALAPAELSIMVSGALTEEDAVHSLLHDFFGEVSINSSASIELPEHIAPQHVFSLVSLSLCESSEAY